MLTAKKALDELPQIMAFRRNWKLIADNLKRTWGVWSICIFLQPFWRVGRAVERGGLENRFPV